MKLLAMKIITKEYKLFSVDTSEEGRGCNSRNPLTTYRGRRAATLTRDGLSLS
jgi:hypothetical protein